jgi:hypothetical protein
MSIAPALAAARPIAIGTRGYRPLRAGGPGGDTGWPTPRIGGGVAAPSSCGAGSAVGDAVVGADGGVRGAVFLAGALFAGAFFAGAFLAGTFFAGAFLAGAFLGVAFAGRAGSDPSSARSCGSVIKRSLSYLLVGARPVGVHDLRRIIHAATPAVRKPAPMMNGHRVIR